MDLTDTIAPKSDQLNADDLLSGPRTFTIKEVRKGASPEQPVDVHLAEFPAGRPWRPAKSMRRVLVAAWGADAATYVGKRVTLFTDPDVRFGGAAVGGIRISHMSDLKKPLTIALTVTRGKRAPYVVKPLADAPVPAAATGTDADKDSISDAQLKAIGAGLTGLGIADREAMLAMVAQIIDREIASSKDLTGAEAIVVLEWIKAEEANAPAEPTLPEGAGPVPTWGADA